MKRVKINFMGKALTLSNLWSLLISFTPTVDCREQLKTSLCFQSIFQIKECIFYAVFYAPKLRGKSDWCSFIIPGCNTNCCKNDIEVFRLAPLPDCSSWSTSREEEFHQSCLDCWEQPPEALQFIILGVLRRHLQSSPTSPSSIWTINHVVINQNLDLDLDSWFGLRLKLVLDSWLGLWTRTWIVTILRQ